MRVAVIHPWLPQYRLAFFRELIARGTRRGIEINVFYGETPPEWRNRDDTRSMEGFTSLKTRFVSMPGRRTLNRKSLRPVNSSGPYDMIIVEQAVRNLETYELLARKAPVAFWGHGRTFTKRVRPQQDRFKQWLTRRGMWFFAYTSEGAEAMEIAGMAPERMTVVQNSIDTNALLTELQGVKSQALAAFEAKYDLHGKTALFVGGLDESKRLPFLFEAARKAGDLDPNFRLLVVGSGDDQGLAEMAAAESPNIHCLGPLFGSEKALALAAAQVIAMPGRVGLVAVDSFASVTPIVTTNWPWHSVEFAYLEANKSAVITDDSVDAYALGLVNTLRDRDALDILRQGCAEAKEKYTLDAMVENFLNGISLALTADHK